MMPMDMDIDTGGFETITCPTQSSSSSVSPDHGYYGSPPSIECEQQEEPEPVQQQCGNENWLPPETGLSKFIEDSVNSIAPASAGRVFVRVISNVAKVMKLSEKNRKFLDNYGIPSQFPYMSKVLMCFQQADNNNDGYVAFFTVFTQEYDERCPPPNRNTVYISMIDSVQLYEPAHYRRTIYYTVLLTYLSYLNENGFKLVFLWSCPPDEGVEYIFHQRPSTQKTPTVEILKTWYMTMMETAAKLKILQKFNTLFQWCPKGASEFFNKLPYFRDDFWPDELDSAIRSYEAVKASGSPAQTKKNTKYSRRSDKGKKKYEKVTPSSCKATTDLGQFGESAYVLEKVLSTMKANPHSFLCMICEGQEDTNNFGVLFKSSYDPENPSVFVDNRDYMVSFFIQNNLKFCDIRTAQLSTAKFLKELREEPLYIYCDICCKRVIIGFSCHECRYDVCMQCFSKKFVHEHDFSTQILCRDAANERDSSGKLPKKLIAWEHCKFHWWANFEKCLSVADSSKCLRIFHHVKSCKNFPCSECMSFRDLGYFRLCSPMRGANPDIGNYPPVTRSIEISVTRTSTRQRKRSKNHHDNHESLNFNLELEESYLGLLTEQLLEEEEDDKTPSVEGLSDVVLFRRVRPSRDEFVEQLEQNWK